MPYRLRDIFIASESQACRNAHNSVNVAHTSYVDSVFFVCCSFLASSLWGLGLM